MPTLDSLADDLRRGERELQRLLNPPGREITFLGNLLGGFSRRDHGKESMPPGDVAQKRFVTRERIAMRADKTDTSFRAMIYAAALINSH